MDPLGDPYGLLDPSWITAYYGPIKEYHDKTKNKRLKYRVIPAEKDKKPSVQDKKE